MTGQPVGRPVPRLAAPAHPVPEHHRRLRARVRRALLGLHVHAQEAGPAVLARPQPARRPLPVQPADLAGRADGQLRGVAARRGPRLVRGRLHSRVPATLLIAVGGFVASAGDTLNRFGVTGPSRWRSSSRSCSCWPASSSRSRRSASCESRSPRSASVGRRREVGRSRAEPPAMRPTAAVTGEAVTWDVAGTARCAADRLRPRRADGPLGVAAPARRASDRFGASPSTCPDTGRSETRLRAR